MSNLTFTLAAKAFTKALDIKRVNMLVFSTQDNLINYLNTRNDLSYLQKNYLVYGTDQGVTTVNKEIFIKAYCIHNPNPILNELAKVEIVAHEFRHVWQLQNGWVFDDSVPYTERKHEIDAYRYATNIITPLLVLTGLAEGIAVHSLLKYLKRKAS